VDNEGEPRQSPPVAVSDETIFFAVSGGECNAPKLALGSVTQGHPQQFYKLI
jgi:hypothetical protein